MAFNRMEISHTGIQSHGYKCRNTIDNTSYSGRNQYIYGRFVWTGSHTTISGWFQDLRRTNTGIVPNYYGKAPAPFTLQTEWQFPWTSYSLNVNAQPAIRNVYPFRYFPMIRNMKWILVDLRLSIFRTDRCGHFNKIVVIKWNSL